LGLGLLERGLGATVGFRGGILFVESECIGAFGEFDTDGIGGTFACVIFRQLRAKAAGLDANHGIDGGIEIRWAAELLCGNLVFLNGGAWVFD
jgi:hypothetical protein